MKLAHAVLGEIETLIAGDFLGHSLTRVRVIVQAFESIRQPGWNGCPASLGEPADTGKIRDRHDAGNQMCIDADGSDGIAKS